MTSLKIHVTLTSLIIHDLVKYQFAGSFRNSFIYYCAFIIKKEARFYLVSFYYLIRPLFWIPKWRRLKNDLRYFKMRRFSIRVNCFYKFALYKCSVSQRGCKIPFERIKCIKWGRSQFQGSRTVSPIYLYRS